MARPSKKNTRIVTYEVVYFDRGTTKTVTKLISGISASKTDAEFGDEFGALFYIMDEFNQEAFCIPFRQLVQCIQLGSERVPRKPRVKKSAKPAVAVALHG